MKTIILILCCTISIHLFAQLPDTEIYLADFSSANGKIKISNAVNITKRKGYDNQPCFSPDGKKVFYVSVIDTTQSDIYSYDLNTKKISQVTATRESEYSSSILQDGKNMTVVRVDADSGQRFYNVPLNQKLKPTFIPGTDSIGYYCRIDDKRYAMFLVGTANTLQILNLADTSRKLIASDIGRSLKLSPDKKFLYYILKSNEREWKVLKLNLETNASDFVLETLSGSEDLIVLPNGALLMGQGSKIFSFTPSKDDYWKEVADLGKTFTKISRMALNAQGSKIVFVDIISAP
ncbi:MAG TPA: hypothetical protein VI757_14380 [Bacteroidia bacterium]|nr:hypothetical protein [Bacteroidia bacterium]